MVFLRIQSRSSPLRLHRLVVPQLARPRRQPRVLELAQIWAQVEAMQQTHLAF